MKKRIAVCALAALYLLAAGAPALAEDMDVVVMVDVTWSLYESFADIEQYLLGALLTDVLKDGDTFHLLWFSDHPETLITGQVTDRKSREAFRSRLHGLRNLQWTYGHYTDLVGAVAYLIQFTDQLPKDHKKLIILVTDGIHDPAPGTVTPADQEALKKMFLSQAEEIKKRGWSIHILKTILEKAGNASAAPFISAFPPDTDLTNLTNGGREDLLAETAGLARIVFPDHLGPLGKKTSFPFVLKNAGKTPVRVTLTAVKLGERNLLVQSVPAEAGAQASGALNAPVEIPDGFADGEQQLTVTLEFQDNPRLVGTTGVVRFTYRKDLAPPAIDLQRKVTVGLWVFPFWAVLVALGGLLVLLLLALLAIVLIRNRGFHSSVRRTLGADAFGKPHFGHRKITEFEKTKTHSFAIEMFVGMQRRHIGQRNIRTIKRNRSATVGGGRSAFLVFLVPVPEKIARIHYDGENFTFRPIKWDFFPGLKGDVPKCLGKEINAVSKKNYPLEISFHRYVSPMEEIAAVFNKLKEQSSVKGA